MESSPWRENLLQFTGVLGLTTLLCIILAMSVLCIVYGCSNPNRLPAWMRTIRDLLGCFKYHPQAEEDTELNMIPLNETSP